MNYFFRIFTLIARANYIPGPVRLRALYRFLNYSVKSAAVDNESRRIASSLKDLLFNEDGSNSRKAGTEQISHAFIQVVYEKAATNKSYEVPKSDELIANVFRQQNIDSELKIEIADRINIWHFVANAELSPSQRKRSMAYPIVDALHPFTQRGVIPFSDYSDLAEKAIDLTLQAIASNGSAGPEEEAYYSSIGERVRSLMHKHPALDALNWTLR